MTQVVAVIRLSAWTRGNLKGTTDFRNESIEGGSSNNLACHVGATAVRTNASTQFRDTSRAGLKARDTVEVKGARQTDASVSHRAWNARNSVDQTAWTSVNANVARSSSH
jgi:hypothetical protein